MKRQTVVRGLGVAVATVAFALLVPGSPLYLPDLLATNDQYEGRSSRSWARDLDGSDNAGRAEAIFALGAIGQPARHAVPALTRIMREDPDPDRRAQASLALSKMGPEPDQVIGPAAESLQDPEPLVRMNAARILFQLGAAARPAVPALIAAVGDQANDIYVDRFVTTVQEHIALALGRASAGTDEGVPALVAALRAAKTNPVRRTIIRALTDIGPAAAGAMPVLRDIQTSNKDRYIQEAVQKAIRQIGGDQPAAHNKGEPELALAESERAYLWDIEHHGNILVKDGFGRLAEALRDGSAAAVHRLLADDFVGTALLDPTRVRASTAFAELERVQDAGRPAVTLDRPAFAARLLEFRKPFATTPPEVKLALITLSPLQRGDLAGPWEGTAQLRLAGEYAATAPAEAVVTLRFEIAAPTEERLAQPGWVRKAGVVQAQTARAPHYLFAEVARARGLRPDRLHDNWDADRVQPNTGGVYVCDFDREGWLDVLVIDLTGATLYRGGPGGRFEDVTVACGLPAPQPMPPVPAGWADMDGDGWEDLVIGSRVFRNERGTGFTDVTRQTNLRLPDDAVGVVAADYDRDGRIDLYVMRTAHPATGSWVDGTSSDAAGNLLLRNLGGWRFENVTRAAGAGGGGRSTFTAAWLDVNDDGWPDLYVGNEFGDGLLLVNRGNGTFAGRTLSDRPADFGTMGLAVGDVDNDGRIDIYSANMYSKAGTRVIGNLAPGAYAPAVMEKLRRFVAGSQLHLNRGGLKFDQAGPQSQVAAVGWAYGATLADLDGDGSLDLYATAGYVSRSRSEPDG